MRRPDALDALTSAITYSPSAHSASRSSWALIDVGILDPLTIYSLPLPLDVGTQPPAGFGQRQLRPTTQGYADRSWHHLNLQDKAVARYGGEAARAVPKSRGPLVGDGAALSGFYTAVPVLISAKGICDRRPAKGAGWRRRSQVSRLSRACQSEWLVRRARSCGTVPSSFAMRPLKDLILSHSSVLKCLSNQTVISSRSQNPTRHRRLRPQP